MLTKFMLIRHQTLTLSQSHFPNFIFSSPSLFSLLHTTTTATTTVFRHSTVFTTAALTSTTNYGPSLQKGISPFLNSTLKPSLNPQFENEGKNDEKDSIFDDINPQFENKVKDFNFDEGHFSTLKPHQNPFVNSTLKPSKNPQFEFGDKNEEELPPFDEGQFTRVYEISAIRVPADKCYEIENRIRGHLLNWPRVPNIARVKGDEVDCEEVVDLIRGSSKSEEEVEKAVSRRIYGKFEGDGDELSEVLYRDKLAKEFNAKGFVKFRNLAKISRPSKRKKRDKKGNEGSDGEEEKGKGIRRKRSVVVEVVEEGGNVGDCDDLSALLGEEFKGRKWRGSTRMLLLDEKYAGGKIDELPEAVKVINF